MKSTLLIAGIPGSAFAYATEAVELMNFLANDGIGNSADYGAFKNGTNTFLHGRPARI